MLDDGSKPASEALQWRASPRPTTTVSARRYGHRREPGAFIKDRIEMMAGPFAEAAGERVDLALGVLNELAEVHPSESHRYLGVLGTHPDQERP